MTDVIDAPLSGARRDPMLAGGEPPMFEMIELFFFAYRDFVQEADHVLAQYGFGRAHHRVLHFVGRNPGLKVTDLLNILKITKQSLGRVLRDLVEDGFIDSLEGQADRRQRLLRTTPRGDALVQELGALQSQRMRHALETAGPGAGDAVRAFLTGMVDPGSALPEATAR